MSSLKLPKNKTIKIIAVEFNFHTQQEQKGVIYSIIPLLYSSIDENKKNLISEEQVLVYQTDDINSMVFHLDEPIVLEGQKEVILGCKFIGKNMEEQPVKIFAYNRK
ncbi:MAG: hypothetical protein Q4C75_06905 [Bergeyella zoohelcum]|nr:hypothetical protein [Bergeyella zoohelcum]